MKKLIALAMTLMMAGGVVRTERSDHTYAIQNVQTGKNVRPYRAKTQDGNRIVLYDHWAWKCMTWEFLPAGENTFHLVNRYTAKALQSAAVPVPGVSLWQQPLQADSQVWEFIEAPGEGYWVRLQGSDLYLTISDTGTNSPLILMPLARSDSQRWRRVAQDPWI